MTNKFAEELRKFIRPYMTQIYDYRTIKIFPDATTSSVILVVKMRRIGGRFYII